MRRLFLVLAVAALGPLMTPAPAFAEGFDEDPATTERIAQTDPTLAAVGVSQARFADAGSRVGEAAFVVLSRDDDFADSLAGAPLSGGGPFC